MCISAFYTYCKRSLPWFVKGTKRVDLCTVCALYPRKVLGPLLRYLDQIEENIKKMLPCKEYVSEWLKVSGKLRDNPSSAELKRIHGLMFASITGNTAKESYLGDLGMTLQEQMDLHDVEAESCTLLRKFTRRNTLTWV